MEPKAPSNLKNSVILCHPLHLGSALDVSPPPHLPTTMLEELVQAQHVIVTAYWTAAWTAVLAVTNLPTTAFFLNKLSTPMLLIIMFLLHFFTSPLFQHSLQYTLVVV